MPSLSTGLKATEGFVDDKDVTTLLSKFFTSNDVDLLNHVGLKMSTAHAGCPEFQIVQLSKKCDHAEITKRVCTGVH